MPTEDEQYEVYAGIVKKLKGKNITIRTVDLGVDKNPRWFGQNSTPNGSLNPALGLTGIRLCLAEPVMFRTQMRAILRAAAHGPVRMMWPMITSISEVRQCLIHLDTAQRQLTERDETFGPVSIGCMIEIPSAAMTVGSILKLVDFVSIGTNDLIQYLLSVDRGDDSVSHLYQPGHPAVLKTLQHIIRTANRMEKGVSICGEMAGDTVFTRLLLGMGLRRFSMNPNNLLSVKNIILHSHTGHLENDTAKILRCEDPEKAEKLIKILNQKRAERRQGRLKFAKYPKPTQGRIEHALFIFPHFGLTPDSPQAFPISPFQKPTFFTFSKHRLGRLKKYTEQVKQQPLCSHERPSEPRIARFQTACCIQPDTFYFLQ